MKTLYRYSKSLTSTLFVLSLCVIQPVFAQEGVTSSTIRVGGIMDLQGLSRGLGQGMKLGLEAAFRGVEVKGRTIQLITANDNYSPVVTIVETQKMIDTDIFVMIGNVGTPTAKVSLPMLEKAKIPAVGFFTGAGILRPTTSNPRREIVNFRASYVQETAAVIRSALQAGVKPAAICAYVQNDAYGMAGVEGIRRALEAEPGMETVTKLLAELIAMEGVDPPRNELAPVGVYKRNTVFARDGYLSLKAWEKSSGTDCQLVVSVGAYPAIAQFTAYARGKGENWVVSAVSFTGADNFRSTLNEFGVREKIVMTQVVPLLNSDLPIVNEARSVLRGDFGFVALEGYIVGKLFVAILDLVEGPLTRESFLAAVENAKFDLGGLNMDFTDDNQGSDFVALTYLDGNDYRAMLPWDWRQALAKTQQ